MGTSEGVRQILHGLQQQEHKHIPFYLLYDHQGSQLYNRITELESYYLFEAEKALLQKHANHIAEQIPADNLIVELGCGIADKTALILSAIRAVHGRCHYVGIDVSSTALREAESSIDEQEGLELEFVQADYLEGLQLVRDKYPDKLMCVLWLGSSIGNLSRSECTAFARDLLTIAGSRCQLFVCVDMWKDESRLRLAYKDQQGITECFIKNGMKHGLQLLGHAATEDDIESWAYEVDINHKSRQVEMYIRFPKGLHVAEQDISIRENERVLVEISRKFTEEDIMQFASQSGFVCHTKWCSPKVYGCYMLFSPEEAFLRCWEGTDMLFKGISDWLAQPVPYRHPFCFYYGHVIAFTKLKLLDADPKSGMNFMFSRGMDPIILDPSKCHNHPGAPASWPDVASLKSYVASGRAEVLEYLKAGKVDMWRVNLCLEHDWMHQETLSYLLVQQRKISFEEANGHPLLSEKKPTEPNRSRWLLKKPDILISKGSVVLGKDPVPGVFRLDNEEPAYPTEVEHDFRVSSTPVSIGEYMAFISEGGYNREELWDIDDFRFLKNSGQQHPATWSHLQGEYFVHLPDGTVHWTEASHKPVFVSLMEAEAFCKWLGCRVMTEAEYQRVLDEEDQKERIKNLRDGGWEWTSSIFSPFPGFTPMQAYPEYSEDFFDGYHYVQKGSSPVTHASLIRDSFRNFYQRQYAYVFAKFRLCKS